MVDYLPLSYLTNLITPNFPLHPLKSQQEGLFVSKKEFSGYGALFYHAPKHPAPVKENCPPMCFSNPDFLCSLF